MIDSFIIAYRFEIRENTIRALGVPLPAKLENAMCDQCSFFTKTQEPYAFLLERREWSAKRLKILTRDGHTCQVCGAYEGSDVRLQVHHKHYIYGLDPWDYKDSELVT